MPDIRVKDLRMTFPNGTVGLHPATLHIPTGSYFVLLGPSGSGKTTLLRLIAGLERPDGGTIHFDDRQVHKLPPYSRGVTFVPQRAALYASRNVQGNIRAGLEFERPRQPRNERLTASKMDDRVNEAADALGIATLLANRAHELSGGEQRRVMLARALVRRTQVWLLDEPLAQLDALLAEKLSQDLHLLQRQFRLTILHVTHDPNEAMALADRVGLLGEGRILQTGPPGEVYSRPSSRTVGLYFGRPPINIVDGLADGSRFVAEWLNVPCPHTGAVTLGIRPEDVGFASRAGFIYVGEVSVTNIRRMDARFLTILREREFEVRGISAEPVQERTSVWLRADRLSWFDATTGIRIDR
jgi:ABC-type sugar transport system ATPase subunit